MDFKEQIIEILFHEYKHQLRSDLVSINPFTFLISVVLSARTKDEQVNKVTSKLFQNIKTTQDMVNLGVSQLERYISTIGLYTIKAKNIIQLSAILLKLGYMETIPSDLGTLLSLPGVGIKTAYVVLHEIFQQTYVAVDTHVFRVARRTGIAEGSNILSVTKELNTMNSKYKHALHHIFIRHGKVICKSIKPQCSSCNANAICKKILYNNKNIEQYK